MSRSSGTFGLPRSGMLSAKRLVLGLREDSFASVVCAETRMGIGRSSGSSAFGVGGSSRVSSEDGACSRGGRGGGGVCGENQMERRDERV